MNAMEPFLYYLLRASVLMALFYGFYKLLLSGNTFHAVNRVVLVSIALASCLLPLFRFHLIPEKKADAVARILPGDFFSIPVAGFVELQPQREIPWVQILMIVVAAGFLFALFRYLAGVVQLVLIIRKSEKQALENQAVLCVTDKRVSPFSWMRYIVLPREELSSENQAVIRHEMAHLHLQHSWDALLFDLLSCLFWFNPFSWLLRREIQSVHEFQADEAVLRSGIDGKQYQLLLIRKSVGEYKFALATNFRRRDLHKRITMMKKDKTNKQKRWNYAMLLPVLFLAVVALSVPKLNAKTVEYVEHKVENTEKANPVIELKPEAVTTVEEEKPKESPKSNVKVIASGQIDSLRGQVEKVSVCASDASKRLIIVDGVPRPEVDLQTINTDNIESITVLKDKAASEIYGEEGKYGVVLITTKNAKKDFGSTSTFTLSTMPYTSCVHIPANDSSSTDQKNKEPVLKVQSSDGSRPLIIVDDEKMPEDFQPNSIDPSDIESVKVLKGEKSIEIYGEEGKNGVIVITKKKTL